MSSDDVASVLRAIGANRGFYTSGMISGSALPYAALTYSLGGEDVAVARFFKWLLKDNHPGIFVDIGCGDPIVISNTYYFYCRGWRGLCVDANAELSPNWAKSRPEDTFLASAIGEERGELHLYRHKSNTGMCKISQNSLGPDFIGPELVPSARLDVLFESHIGDKPIQFMNIDIEGSELGALRSNDWTRWRPRVILMECNKFTFSDPTAHPTVSFLLERGYEIQEKIGENVLMVECAQSGMSNPVG